MVGGLTGSGKSLYFITISLSGLRHPCRISCEDIVTARAAIIAGAAGSWRLSFSPSAPSRIRLAGWGCRISRKRQQRCRQRYAEPQRSSYS